MSDERWLRVVPPPDPDEIDLEDLDGLDSSVAPGHHAAPDGPGDTVDRGDDEGAQRYDAFLRWLTTWTAAEDDTVAAFVGGSRVTGGFDRWSDLDVTLLTAEGAAVDVHEALLTDVAAVHPVDHVWRLPDDTHPDGRQSFVSFQQRPGSLSDDVLLVDVSVHDLSPARSRVDVRRHGVPQVLTGGGSLDLVAYGAADSPRPAQLLAALAQARARLGTGEWLVHRAIRRGARAEAADLHQRFALASLARLLRIRHCPWRHDYGLRYLADDLGPDLARRVEDLLPVGDLEDQAERCFAWQRSLLEGPDVVAWPEHDGRVLAGLDTGAAPQRVWEALTDGDALATWWGRLEGRPAAGAAYTIWHGEQHPAHHRVRTWEPGRRLVLGWSFPDEPDSELVLEIDDDGRLTLEHTGVADAAEYAAGWEQHLRFLHAHLAGSPLPWDMFWEDWEARYTAHRDLLTRQARPPAQ